MKDITSITKGVIMHQVNCQNVMGSGVAKAIYTKYPQVKSEFHKLAQVYTTPQSYSQLNYGKNRNIRYTNETLLITNLRRLDEYAKNRQLPAYVPEYIGCGLGNGDWDTIKNYIENQTNIIIVSK